MANKPEKSAISKAKHSDREGMSAVYDELMVVGIGSSAGGLEALQSLVPTLPKDSKKYCYIVAQHLSPSYKSMMMELLEKYSAIPILAAQNDLQVQADHIYICPQNVDIEIAPDNRLVLLEPNQEQMHSPKPSIDLLFESIALYKRENAIGILLSGTGSDGARGLRAIKAEGGVSIVQDPATAKFDGMPLAAINSGNIDIVLGPQEMGEQLRNLLSFSHLSTYELGKIEIPVNLYKGVLKAIQRSVNVDFSLYKENTILRRIDRRMSTLKITGSENYFHYLQNNAKEVECLYRDILIGVTSFFRDAKAFDVLKNKLDAYLSSKSKEDKVLRIWVVGCSTGEEAYSVAMMLSDLISERNVEVKVQIFATDIDSNALEVARKGIYPESALHNLPASFKKRFFRVKGDCYEVNKPIKGMILFSKHNLVADPPFLKLDLISCRNLLIYFGLELQKTVMPLFHYCLKDGGLLFLGKSESVGVFHDYFKPLERTAKVFEALFLGRKAPLLKPVGAKLSRKLSNNIMTSNLDNHQVNAKEISPRPTLADITTRVLNKIVLPNSLVINENMDIIYSQGENPFLVRPQGEPTNNVYKNMLPSLSADLRAAVHMLSQERKVVKTDFQKIISKDNNQYARLIVTEAPDDLKLGRLYMVFIQAEDELQVPISLPDEARFNTASDVLVKEQERQITNIRTQLQTVIEELETSNEEMQSLNEELQSANEELQSSNEELETTNEELQSTNEELQTAYTELRLAYEEKDHQKKELERTEDELRRTSEMVSEAERLGQNGSWMMQIGSREMCWSHGCYNLFDLSEDGFKPSYEALVGLTYQNDRTLLENYFSELFMGHPADSLKIRCNRGTNDSFWLKITAHVLFNDLMKPVKVLGNMLDVTDEVLRSHERESHRNLVRGIISNSLNGIYLYSFIEMKNSYINEAYTDLTGYTQNEIDLMSDEQFSQLFKPEELDEIVSHMEKVKQSKDGQIVTIQYHFKTKAGSYVKLVSNDSVFERDAKGLATSMIGNFYKSQDPD